MSSRPDSAAALGTVLVGRYRLDATLGAGGMAEVFRATDTHTGRAVAVKILRGQSASNREAVMRLKREGEVLSALRHAAIVAVEAAYELEGGVFLVMELLEGETLGARMKRGIMTPMELAPIVAGVAAGLSAAHAQNVVHRDLKPDNVFLVPDAQSGREGALRVKLLDFGISKVWYGEKLTQTGQVLGTPRYMSPEQLGAEVDVDPRIDVYALGVILYEALAGTPPFLATSPTDLIVAILHGKVAPLRAVRPELSPAIEAVVMRAMARSRDARFGTARELADAFLDAAGVGESFRLAPKKGLETRAMGSVRDDELSGLIHAQLPPPDEITGSSVRPGTFSELPAFAAPAPAATILQPMEFDANGLPVVPGAAAMAAVASPAPTPPLGSDLGLAATAAVPPGAPPARAIPRTAVSQLPADPFGATSAAPPGASPAVSETSTPVMAPSPATSAPWSMHAAQAQAPLHASSLPPDAHDRSSGAGVEAPPRQGLGWWLGLLVVGLLAGGLTAGAVIALLHWWRPEDTAAPPPPPLAAPDASSPDAFVPPPPDAGTTAPSEPTPERRTPRATATIAEVLDADAGTREENGARPPPPGEGANGAGTRDEDAGRRAGQGSAGQGSRGEPEPTDPLSLARRALRGGDPTGCVDILDDLIAQGATPIALRDRAACLMRLGEQSEAIRDYQRFCRLAPDHPAIGEVRDLLEGMGQTCP
jgi:serine/threonine-protein kinase